MQMEGSDVDLQITSRLNSLDIGANILK